MLNTVLIRNIYIYRLRIDTWYLKFYTRSSVRGRSSYQVYANSINIYTGIPGIPGIPVSTLSGESDEVY